MNSAASLALSLGVVEEVGALRSHSSERPDAAEDITAIPVPSPSFGEEVAAQPRGPQVALPAVVAADEQQVVADDGARVVRRRRRRVAAHLAARPLHR